MQELEFRRDRAWTDAGITPEYLTAEQLQWRIDSSTRPLEDITMDLPPGPCIRGECPIRECGQHRDHPRINDFENFSPVAPAAYIHFTFESLVEEVLMPLDIAATFNMVSEDEVSDNEVDEDLEYESAEEEKDDMNHGSTTNGQSTVSSSSISDVDESRPLTAEAIEYLEAERIVLRTDARHAEQRRNRCETYSSTSAESLYAIEERQIADRAAALAEGHVDETPNEQGKTTNEDFAEVLTRERKRLFEIQVRQEQYQEYLTIEEVREFHIAEITASRLAREAARSNIVCGICGADHDTEQCILGAVSANQSSTQIDNELVKCAICDGNHSVAECIAAITAEALAADENVKIKRKRCFSDDEEPSNIKPKRDEDDDDNDKDHSKFDPYSSPTRETTSAFSSTPTANENCILDSGCSTTTMKSMERFTIWKNANKQINTASDSVIINRVGPVGPFQNVYFMPSLHMDLVSLGDIDELGIDMTIKEGTLSLRYNNRLILSVLKSKNVWIVNTDSLLECITEVLKPESFWWMAQGIDEEIAKLPQKRSERQASEILALYHLRLGHRSERLIIEAVNSKLINIGVLPVDKLSAERHRADHPCQCCATSKSHKLPRASRPVQKPMRRVYYSEKNPNFKEGDDKQQGFFPGQVSTDMCGPYTIPSFRTGFVGNQNFMLMDSKEIYIYGYTKKNDSVRNLKDLIEVKLKHKGLPIVSYHSDGAPELIGKDITSYLSKLGVKNTYTTPYTPQENSYMERHFRTENEGTLAMICYARFLPKSMWFFAKESFTYIYNRLPTQTAKGIMSPYQYRTGRVPDLTHLRVWGCKCYANIDLSLRRKDFAARAMTGYLVGYSDLQKDAYKIWIPQSDKIIVSRDVKFDENIPQGTIDHSVDVYWKEIRQFQKLTTRKVREPEDFYYLIGIAFYDHDIDAECIVTRIEVIGKAKVIVAYIKKLNADRSVAEEEEYQPIHVAEVESLLGTYYEEKSIGEINAVALAIALAENELAIDEAKLALQSTEEVVNSQPEYLSIPPKSSRRATTEVRNTGENNSGDRGNGFELPISGVSDLSITLVDLPRLHGVDYSDVMCYISENVIDPKGYNEAVSGPDGKEWREAIAIEIDNLKRKGVVIEVKRPADLRKLLGTKYVFKTKFKHGSVDKRKARCVAKGYRQIKDVDYAETFVPVARMNTFRFFLVISVNRRHTRLQIDFVAAFLVAPIVEDIYIETPDGWEIEEGNVLKLLKSLYGLKQAGRNWYQVLIEFLIKAEGFTMCISDHCVFTKDNGNIMILIYVDDVIISSLNPIDGTNLLSRIKANFEIGEEGPLDWYIGMNVKDTGNSIELSQSHYIKKAIEKYGYDKNKVAESPMKDSYAIEKKPDDELFEDENIRSKIGTLMYTAVCVRPDIAFAVNYLARFTVHPSAEVCRAVDRIFHYLNGTQDYGIKITQTNDMSLIVYCDADLAGGGNDMKSVSGVVAYLCGCLICWYSTKQSTVAQSSCEAEILAMNFAAKEIVWLRGFLEELNVDQTKPTRLLTDSQSAINLTYNPIFHKRTKHVMIKIKYLIECVDTEQIILEFVRTHLNFADCMTKMQKLSHFKTAIESLRVRL